MQQWAKSFVISQKFDFYNDDLDFEKHNINTQKFKTRTSLCKKIIELERNGNSMKILSFLTNFCKNTFITKKYCFIFSLYIIHVYFFNYLIHFEIIHLVIRCSDFFIIICCKL